MGVRKILILVGLVTVAATLLVLEPLEKLRLAQKYYLTPCPAKGPAQQTDFPIYELKLDLPEYYSQLFSFKEAFDVQQVTSIKYQNKEYPILQISTKNAKVQQKILIIATVHGNEPASALAASQLLKELQEDQANYSDWQTQVLVPANPVGLANNSRYNGDGCDINRDFNRFQTVEARVQRRVIEKFSPDIIISLHESPRDGFFVITESNVPRKLEQKMLDDLRESGVNLGNQDTMGLPLLTKGLRRKGVLTYGIQQLFGVSTFGKYANSLGIPTIITESNWKDKDLQSRVFPHLVVIKSALDNF